MTPPGKIYIKNVMVSYARKNPIVVYRHWDADGTLLYVGSAACPIKRLHGHTQASTWFAEVTKVTIERFDTPQSARAAEIEAIRSEKPRHNINMQVDCKVCGKAREAAIATSRRAICYECQRVEQKEKHRLMVERRTVDRLAKGLPAKFKPGRKKGFIPKKKRQAALNDIPGIVPPSQQETSDAHTDV